MGRKKDTANREQNADLESTPTKKRKANSKQKKRKTQAEKCESDGSIDVSIDDSNTKPIVELKAANELNEYVKPQSSKRARVSPVTTAPKSLAKKKKSNKSKESGASSEEERWLNAIESGKLEEMDDELKKIKPKDPKMMTARQRAMYERDKEPSPGGEVLLALPSGYKEKVMTVEALQKAAIKSQKRKQLADEKREKNKIKTMERLLKKQQSKAVKGNTKPKLVKQQVPMISYRNTVDAITMSIPPDVTFPLLSKEKIEPPKPVMCGTEGCTNLKKYSCSQTGIPLCSLQCYKKNLANVVS